MGKMMIQKKIIGLLSALFAVVLIGCEGRNFNGNDGNGGGPVVVIECVASLAVTINFVSPVPQNLRILWNGSVAVDECANQKQGPIIMEKDGNKLFVDDGGFGYTAPQFLDLQIFDQGTCGSETEIFSVEDYQVSETKPKLCEPFAAELNE